MLSLTPLTLAASMTCTLIADFSDPAEQRRWQVVNDGVMGGLSRGFLEGSDDGLRFYGEIVTDGGGFSSIRRRADGEALAGVSRLRVTMESDGRQYQMSLRSDVAWRGRSVAYRHDLVPDGAGAAMVEVADLEPSIFGQRVRAPAYSPEDTRTLGFILADGRDGAFDMTLKRIEACA